MKKTTIQTQEFKIYIRFINPVPVNVKSMKALLLNKWFSIHQLDVDGTKTKKDSFIQESRSTRRQICWKFLTEMYQHGVITKNK